MIKWGSEDIYNIRAFSSPQFSNSENEIVFVENGIDIYNDKYVSRIIRHDLLSECDEVLTAMTCSNKNPIYLQGSDKVIYLSDVDGASQVYSLDIHTKMVVKHTNSQFGVKNILAHPDGKRFFFTTTVERGISSFDWSYKYQKKDVYEITELGYFKNGAGIIDSNLCDVVCEQEFASRQANVICEYSLGYGTRNPINISKDGRYLAVEMGVIESHSTKIMLYDLSGEDIAMDLNTIAKDNSEYIGYCGLQSEPVFSNNGKYIAFVGNNVSYHTSNQSDIYLFNFENKSIINLTKNLDVHFSDYMVCDTTRNNSNRLICFSDDCNYIYATASVEGAVCIMKIDVESGLAKDFILEDEHITNFAISGEKMIITYCSPKIVSAIDEINLSTLERENIRKSKHEKEFAGIIALESTSSDGSMVPAFLVLPETFSMDKKYPLIVNIHGGPYTMHGYTFHHEIQMMASQGYAVLLVNPRGSFGYGQEHLKAVVGDYGGGDYNDIMAAVDNLLSRVNVIDKENLFVTGGSYGGFMTNWIITHTNRFKAACTQRSMCNFVSQFGTSDIGYYFYKDELDADILEPEKLWKFSPLAYVKNVTTPTLILHSEEDYRCAVEQADQWFAALKYIGVETRYIRFPNSNHELSRNGIPKYRVKRLEEIMMWFQKYTTLNA